MSVWLILLESYFLFLIFAGIVLTAFFEQLLVSWLDGEGYYESPQKSSVQR